MKYNPDTGALEGTWRVPEIEGMNRRFEEDARFYNLPENRCRGVKFVPPPAVMDDLENLRE